MEMTYREAAEQISKFADKEFRSHYIIPIHHTLILEAMDLAVKVLNEKADIEDLDLRIKDGDPVWYVDTELQEIEEGRIVHVEFKNSKVDSISVDFLESGDFDEFDGSAMNECLFTTEEAAKLALCNYMK